MSDTIEIKEGETPNPAGETIQAVPAAESVSVPHAETREPSRERTDRGRGRRGYYDSSDRGDKESSGSDQMTRLPKFKKKICNFCADKNIPINYKRPDLLERFITDRGKILPRRVTGTCARHQRIVAREIKRARIIALLPFIEL